MSDQEMQFADPDWKPTQPLQRKTSPQDRERYNPQPINTNSREQTQWKSAPSSSPQQEGYTGLYPYAGTAPQQTQGGGFRQQQYRRRGRGPWFWIILAIILISLMSGGLGSNGFGFGRPHFGNYPIPMQKPQDFIVNGQPTIVINDANGAVHVNAGSSISDVVIQSVPQDNFPGNTNVIQPNISQNGNTITASVPDGQQGSVDFTVTVPQDSNLRLIMDSGNISVNGVDGQMTLTTSGGNINASNDVINGQSTITTDYGDISFDGTIGAGGTYQFITSSGSVNLSLPSAPAFHVDATTSSGSMNTSDFPSVHFQNNGNKASSDVGVSSQVQGAKVTINTDSGNIDLHQR